MRLWAASQELGPAGKEQRVSQALLLPQVEIHTPLPWLPFLKLPPSFPCSAFSFSPSVLLKRS